MGRRILFVSEFPLTVSARSFLSRSSIEVENAPAFDLAAIGEGGFELVVLEESRLDGPLETAIETCAQKACKVLVLSDQIPDPALLNKTEAFLVAPFTQSELIGAIGDILGTALRRALRLGVDLPARLTRSGDRVSSASVLQLSETGCLLEVESSLQVGEEVSVSFVLPSNREELVLPGTIVSGNELQLLYGVRFGAGTESARLAILVFVELGLASGESESPRVHEAKGSH